jgi:hypothetical protein
MIRKLSMTLALVASAFSLPPFASAATGLVKGIYLETRTCQVYTGPCFANGESGLAGRDAIMAWHIDHGVHEGVELGGLSVVMVVHASDTLGFQGLENAEQVRSVMLVDERATPDQREALVKFAKSHSGKAGAQVARIDSRPIEMTLNLGTLNGQLSAGRDVTLSTRKANPGDCICSNEVAYYPPLARVEHFVPAVTVEGAFQGRGLGTRWSTPESRSAYMATFSYE